MTAERESKEDPDNPNAHPPPRRSWAWLSANEEQSSIFLNGTVALAKELWDRAREGDVPSSAAASAKLWFRR